jgi:hypothetical protein
MRRGEGPVVDPCARGTLSGTSRDGVEHAIHGLSQEQFVGFFDGEREPQAPTHLGFHAAREIFAVDEHAIAVEDQRRQLRVRQTSLSSFRG